MDGRVMDIRINKITIFRKPSLEDGRALWELVSASKILDINSPYCYLLICKDFAETSVVAEQNREVVGFIAGYRPPANLSEVFVWQIAVAEHARGQGLGTAMLMSLLQRHDSRNISRLLATVTPSNLPSKRLFQSLAKRLNTQYTEQDGFGAAVFPNSTHEPENMIRVGPFNL